MLPWRLMNREVDGADLVGHCMTEISEQQVVNANDLYTMTFNKATAIAHEDEKIMKGII